MNRHQVLTGAANAGDHCYAVGSVEGVHFTAYAAGCDIVILASDFQRVQIIPGASHGYIQVTCIDCCTDTGKIAASYGRKVCVFEPTPLLHQDSLHKLDYQWYHTGTLHAECEVLALTWNPDGSKLLTAGEFLQMWQSPDHVTAHTEPENVEFFIEDVGCIWRCQTATPVTLIRFSHDGLLFASLGKNDRLVKIWYENKKVELPLARGDSQFSPKRDEFNYSFVYVAHPRAVTGFTWRKTSKYMPRGSVANMLITSCRDNICRVWCETILPEDGLVDVHQLDPTASVNPMFHTQRHKKRFMQRLHHIRHLMHKRKQQGSRGQGGVTGGPPLPSAQSIHDFHKFGIHPNSIAPGFHFHLAASINPDADIPLLPTLGTADRAGDPNFVVHWLNNKEFYFTTEAEKIMDEMTRKTPVTDDACSSSGSAEHQPDPENDDLLDMFEASVHHHTINTAEHKPPGAASSPALHADALKRKRAELQKSHSYMSTESERSTISTVSGVSGVTQNSDAGTVIENVKGLGTDPLDHRIETLLRQWHQSADMLFSIHPVDGSFLVWLVEYLDEPNPGSFRQVQISFSSRIPQAIPVGDATSMSPDLLLYCNHARVDLKSALKESESQSMDNKGSSPSINKLQANAMGRNSPGQSNNTLLPNVLMISKHNNGSLNQWQLSFAETSHFATVLSIAHASRVCGHRFQTNSATCHPVLPLLLTTSHHNVPDLGGLGVPNNDSATTNGHNNSSGSPDGFCSELILWKVDPVGPLSKSGGVVELARINSPETSAFTNVAWIPTLLPSSTLGAVSNSPSTLFVASDGISLHIYQAVVDARTLLAELNGQRRKETINLSGSCSSTSSGLMMATPTSPAHNKEMFNIVSQQSTSRPGCIIELGPVIDGKQDWQHLQLIHVFQEQMVCGSRATGAGPGQHPSGLEPMVDLQNSAVFEEHFYLVVVEKVSGGSPVLHMWRIVIASQGGETGPQYHPDVNFYQDHEDSPASSRSNTPEPPGDSHQQHASPHITVHSNKVCTQTLALPDGVSVVMATVAAGHLSSSSIYPACFAPYLLSTACSDGCTRFWTCNAVETPGGQDGRSGSDRKFEWSEWEMLVGKSKHSTIRVPGKPLSISCAYSGRIAVAYRMGGIKNRHDDPYNRYVNLCVSIYECESTGGSEWTLEDTIELKNVTISDPKVEIDLSRIYYDQFEGNHDNHSDILGHHSNSQVIMSPTFTTPAIVKTMSIPSPSTVQSVKKMLSIKESKTDLLKPRRLIQLDWVSTEDGSHILTVSVGSTILLYAAVSSEISQASMKDTAQAAKAGRTRGILQKSKSMIVQNFVEEIRWMRVRSMELQSADGLPPLPMHVSWVRDGILVVGMDNEMHVYCQWRGPGEDMDSGSRDQSKDGLDSRALVEQNLQKVSSTSSLNLTLSKSYNISQSMSSIKLDASISNLSLLADKSYKDKDRKKDLSSSWGTASKSEFQKSDSTATSIVLSHDYGLFEAARMTNPVLPQYHPRQLIELLNFGKIRRVKAILAHLVRCISGGDTQCSDPDATQRQRLITRGMSIAPASKSDGSKIPEEMTPDYIEISSIPPLPLYALVSADEDLTPLANLEPGNPETAPTAPAREYDTLLDTTSFEDEVLEDPFDNDDVFQTSSRPVERKKSTSQMQTSRNYFGPAQSQLLANHLTHTHLPGLSSLDQMYLLALADTVANTRLDFSEKQAGDVANKTVLDRELGLTEPVSTDSIDDCGLRYLLASRHHVYLLNTLPIRQRAALQVEGLSPAYFIWAFHSDAAEELINVLPNMQKGEPTWEEMRQFGCGLWVQNINMLRRCIEKVAKTAFQARKDPLDAALFYIAMKKKNLVWGLFRSVNDNKMMTFFRNNFSEDRWRKAALKNAFALLGRQRFRHAAAFFLLGGAVRDAIEVCLNKMEDLQLAIVITRLYESELDETMPTNLKRLLYEECLGCDQYGQNYDPCNTHPNPFIRSMAYWMVKDYSAALGTLLETIGSSRRIINKNEDMESYSANPSVFNFYNYLRTHPLLVRQQLAQSAADKSKSVFLSGFSKGLSNKSGDKNVTYVDCITPIERRLYFMTAHAHFKSGCPALALEVLSKLPDVIDTEHDITKSHSIESVTPKSPIDSGTLDTSSSQPQKATDLDWSKPMSNGIGKDTDSINNYDWSKPVSSAKNSTVDPFDWSKPESSKFNDTSGALDWSQPISRFSDDKLDLTLTDDDEDGDTKSDSEIESKDKLLKSQSSEHREDEDKEPKLKKNRHGDIMAQQLKFIACLKIMMEELSTLATGFEVDGGQLRYQLYIWLEKEVDMLTRLCNYGHHEDPFQKTTSSGKPSESSMTQDMNSKMSGISLDSTSASKPTLHEIILAEKMDFEAKLNRMSRRKAWLKKNQQLLRTLLGYSVLHGASGGGLASVRMELILLLQELQQEKTQQQLLSPLPFPTTLPLLSASIASAKTVISDPIRHLQSITQDILHSIIEHRSPPGAGQSLGRVYALRNLSAALSACIYQCLCDSDSFVVTLTDTVAVGMEGFTSTNVVYKDSYLMAGAQRRRNVSSTGDDLPNSAPAKWPGVSSLRALLAREQDDDSPKLTILLCESLIGVYMSLLIHALAMFDANLLFRLVSHPFIEGMWPLLFGGGVKKLVKMQPIQPDLHNIMSHSPQDDVSKQRMKLHMKVLGKSASQQHLKENKPTYKEKFVPPELSMVSYFMTKPQTDYDRGGIDYDSADSLSSDEEEDEEELSSQRNQLGQREHLDPGSYSWTLMRYAIAKYVRYTLVQFLPQIGIELPELPVCSPLVQSVLKTLEQWEEVQRTKLELFQGPPSDFIPGCFVDSLTNGPTITKYKAMLESLNTPFLSSHYSALPAKRLWHYLVHQKYLQDVFIRYIFKKRKTAIEEDSDSMRRDTTGSSLPVCSEPMKIIHKEQDTITAFCLNQSSQQMAYSAFLLDSSNPANLNCIAMATPKEIVEMDVTGILYPPVWLEDETEYDIETIRMPSPSRLDPEEFLVVQTAADRQYSSGSAGAPPTAPGAVPAPTATMGQSGRGGSVMKGINIPGITNPNFSNYIVDRSRRLLRRLTKRAVTGVRRMGAHPHLPYYLSGSQDGSVRLWEWGHRDCIAVARPSGHFPKVSKVLFSEQGNKFGVADTEGAVCLWQVGLGVNMNKPYLNLKCHNKSTSDFVFVGSSSLLATAGHSSDSRNVCLWDTLLPQKTAQVQAFHCHQDGSPAVLYAPQHQVLISAGKKGDICIFDVRQRQLRQTFQAHDSPIKTMALDPTEEYFVTGAADGDIKVWGLTVHNLVYSFLAEHTKGSIFRQTGVGVTQVYLSPQNHLFSCGADGSMKVRQLAERELIVHSLTSSTLSSAS